MRNVLLWILALVITLAAMVYQRATGPTHPARGKTVIGGVEYRYEFLRSHDLGDAPVEIAIADPEVGGLLVYKRFKVDEEWTEIPLQRQGDLLKAGLPHQPPAGKIITI